MPRLNKIDFITLPLPDDSLSFFQTIKNESEKYWTETSPNNTYYGLQIQQNTQWKKGLTEKELEDFQSAVGLIFPPALKNFYLTMNGLTKPGINLYGKSNTPIVLKPLFYSYPEDLTLIKEMIEWIYESTSVKTDVMEALSISRIFPVFQHRFILIDNPDHSILSMYGDDIIYCHDSLSKLLANTCFNNIYNVWDFESNPHTRPQINFWLD